MHQSAPFQVKKSNIFSLSNSIIPQCYNSGCAAKSDHKSSVLIKRTDRRITEINNTLNEAEHDVLL